MGSNSARGRRGALACAVVVLALTAATQVPSASTARSSAAPNADDTSEDVVLTPEEALAADISLTAEQNGVSVESAERLYADSETLGAVAVDAASRWPKQFVGSAVSPSDGGGPTLYMKGTPPAELLDNAKKRGVRVVGGQPFSFDELEQRKRLVHQTLEGLGYDFVTTSFDVEDGDWIDAHVGGQPSLSIERIFTALPSGVRSAVRLTVSDDTSGWSDLNSFGGMRVRDDGAGECTSGWSVRHLATDDTGVTSAGHCTGINEINHLTHGIHALNFRQEHRGQWGDVEWYTSPQPEPAQFFADNGEIRDVISREPRAGISQDEPVCYYGRSSDDRDCSLEVNRVSIGCTNSGVANDRLVEMNGAGIALPGDSGGPFFYSNRAFGSIKGFCEPNEWLSFSVQDLYDEALGVVVRVQ